MAQLSLCLKLLGVKILQKLIIRKLEETEYERWDKFVANSPQGTLFHKSYWLKASGQTFNIYGYFKDDKLIAGLPIGCGDSKLGIKIATHPSLTPYLGVIFGESEAKYVTRISKENEISRAIAVKIKDDFDSIYFRFTPFSIDLLPFIWEGFSIGVRYTYLLDLNDLKDVWEGMDATRRRNIRRAEKDGIYVDSNMDFKEMFILVEKAFERQKKRVTFRSFAFKYNEVLHKKKQCNSFIARNKNGKAIAGVYIVWDEKRAYYVLGGYDSEESHHGATAIAIWEAIKFIKRELELSQFDFEGSMIQPIEQFFRKFGGRCVPYYSVYYEKPMLKFLRAVRGVIKK